MDDEEEENLMDDEEEEDKADIEILIDEVRHIHNELLFLVVLAVIVIVFNLYFLFQLTWVLSH
jgi:hypothetical protein